jgi:uncharacterized membrane protein YgcG
VLREYYALCDALAPWFYRRTHGCVRVCCGCTYGCVCVCGCVHADVLIKRPISLQCILKRIRSTKAPPGANDDDEEGEGDCWYGSMQDFVADVQRLFNNARTYNLEGSLVVQDADTLEHRVKKAYKKMHAKRAKRLASKGVKVSPQMVELRKGQEAAEQARQGEMDRALALLAEAKETNRNSSSSSSSSSGASGGGGGAQGHTAGDGGGGEAAGDGGASSTVQQQQQPPPPTAAEMGLPYSADFGLCVVEAPSKPRATLAQEQEQLRGEGADGSSSSSSPAGELIVSHAVGYQQLLGELLASVPESAGAMDERARQEAARLYGNAAAEMTLYEQAVASASERNAARAVA